MKLWGVVVLRTLLESMETIGSLSRTGESSTQIVAVRCEVQCRRKH